MSGRRSFPALLDLLAVLAWGNGLPRLQPARDNPAAVNSFSNASPSSSVWVGSVIQDKMPQLEVGSSTRSSWILHSNARRECLSASARSPEDRVYAVRPPIATIPRSALLPSTLASSTGVPAAGHPDVGGHEVGIDVLATGTQLAALLQFIPGIDS